MMTLFKDSRRWLCANLVLLAGMVAIGAVAPPTWAAAGGTSFIGMCERGGCNQYDECTNCSQTQNLECGLLSGGVGRCQVKPSPLGCKCE